MITVPMSAPRNLAENHCNHPLQGRVQALVAQMARDNLLYTGRGFCAAMSDLLIRLLSRQGIQAHAVEVTLTVHRVSPPMMINVGFGHRAEDGPEVGTHVVTVIEHERPLLVDLSIGHWLEPDAEWIMAPVRVSQSSAEPLLRVDTDNISVSYHERVEKLSPATIELGIQSRIQWNRTIARQIRTNWTLGIITTVLLLFTAGLLTTRSIENRNLITRNIESDQQQQRQLELLDQQRQENRRLIDSNHSQLELLDHYRQENRELIKELDRRLKKLEK